MRAEPRTRLPGGPPAVAVTVAGAATGFRDCHDPPATRRDDPDTTLLRKCGLVAVRRARDTGAPAPLVPGSHRDGGSESRPGTDTLPVPPEPKPHGPRASDPVRIRQAEQAQALFSSQHQVNLTFFESA